MADEPTNDDPAPEPDPKDDPPEPKPDPEPAQEPDWKAEARKWEQRAKANKEAADKLAEIEESKKSETQKLQDRIAQLEPTALEAARLRVALRKGLTESQAKRLVGTSEEEFETDADQLLEDLGSKSNDDPPSDGGGRPKERLRPGATPSSEPDDFDPKKIADSIPRRY